MGLFSKIFYGIDTDEEQRRSDSLDAALRVEQAADVARNPEKFLKHDAEVQAHIEAGRIDVDAEVNDAFQDGLKEGAGNIRGGIGGTLNALVVTPLKIIPWQFWLAGAVYLAWRLGLLKPLLAKLKS